MKTGIALALSLLLVSIMPSAIAKNGGSDIDITLLEDSYFCLGPSVAPGSDKLTFISNRGGPVRIWQMTPSDGEARPLSFQEGQPRTAAWSPVDDIVAVEAAPGGSDKYQVYLLSADGERIEKITGTDDINRFYGWSPDGRYIYMTSNRDAKEALSAYRYSVETGEWMRLTHGPAFDNVEDTARDGSKVLIWRLAQASDEELFLLDIPSKSRTPVLPAIENGGTIPSAVFGPGGLVFAASNRYTDLAALLVFDPETGKTRVGLQRDDAELDFIATSPDSSLLLAHWNSAGRSDMVIYDAETLQEISAVPIGNGVAFRWRWTPDSRAVVFQLVAQSGNNVWRFDVANETLVQVTDCGGAGKQDFTVPRLVTFESFDGIEISGWLYKKGDVHESAPLIIQFHGGPEGQSRPLINGFYEILNRAGIAVFAANVRGSIGFGKTFETLDNGPKRWDAIRDIKSTHDALIERGIAKRGHVGVMGRSYGGFLTMAAVTTYPDTFAAAVDMYGKLDLAPREDNSSGGWHAHLKQSEFGDPEKDAEFFEAISPLRHLENISTPVLFIQGKNDLNTPPEQTIGAYEGLKTRNVPTRLILFPDEGHGIARKDNQLAMIQSVVNWFDRYLVNDAGKD